MINKGFQLFITSLSVLYAQAATTSSGDQQQTYSTNTARRERNLDHWDADTLAYYLGIDADTGKPLSLDGSTGSNDSKETPYAGIDAACLFYAQWDSNSHAVAPYWDAIATHIKAGSKQSNIIMSLFDCELNKKHSALCTAAGITHYPTMMFIGSGPYYDNDVVTKTIFGKNRAAGPAGHAPLPRTIKFQGNWKYFDSILDWVTMMQRLSKWHSLTSEGFLRHLRNGILGFLRPGKMKKLQKQQSQSLPVGIPPVGSSSGGGSGSSGGASAATVSAMEKALKASENESKQYKKLATHQASIVESFLFPVTVASTNTNGTNTSSPYIDVFSIIAKNDGWNLTTEENIMDDNSDVQDLLVVKLCALDLSMDYCSKLSTHVTNEYIDELEKTLTPDKYPTLSEMEKQLKTMIQEREPFCYIYDDCLASGFVEEKCRPSSCPFKQDIACRYLTSCASDVVLRQYNETLQSVREEYNIDENMMTTKKKQQGNDAKKPTAKGWIS